MTFQIDITWFPFDDQECELKFGSWTYQAGALNLTLTTDKGDISDFKKNGVSSPIMINVIMNIFGGHCKIKPLILNKRKS